MAIVGCAGILVADMFCGPVATLPEPGELLLVDDMPMSAGGCAANVAIDLALQGIDVEVSGCVGDDASADSLISELRRARIGCDRIVRAPHLPTSKTIILLTSGEDRRYVHTFGANGAFSVCDIDPDWAKGLQVLYIGGLFALPGVSVEELAFLLEECRQAGVTTVVDVVVPRDSADVNRLDLLLPHIDYFVPNSDEARIFTGVAESQDQISSLRSRGAHTVIVTCGAHGSVAGDGERMWRAEACRLEAVDPSGSGDAFTSGVITGIVRGWDLAQMLRYGNALGASAARAVGTTGSVFRDDEATAFLVRHPIEVREVQWK